MAVGIARLLDTFSLDRKVAVRPAHIFGLVDGDRLPKDRDHGQMVAYRDSGRVIVSDSLPKAVAGLMAELNREVIRNYSGLAVHSGVVSDGESAMAFPAVSGGGKSTLTAAVVKAGFEYVSDEALFVDPDTELVAPYPKPFGLSAWSRGVVGVDDSQVPFPVDGGEALIPPQSLGAVATSALPLRHVVLAEIDGAAPVMEEIAAGEAMAALLRMSFNHYKLGEDAFHLAASVAEGCRAWRLGYRDPREAAELIGQHLT